MNETHATRNLSLFRSVAIFLCEQQAHGPRANMSPPRLYRLGALPARESDPFACLDAAPRNESLGHLATAGAPRRSVEARALPGAPRGASRRAVGSRRRPFGCAIDARAGATEDSTLLKISSGPSFSNRLCL